MVELMCHWKCTVPHLLERIRRFRNRCCRRRGSGGAAGVDRWTRTHINPHAPWKVAFMHVFIQGTIPLEMAEILVNDSSTLYVLHWNSAIKCKSLTPFRLRCVFIVFKLRTSEVLLLITRVKFVPFQPHFWSCTALSLSIFVQKRVDVHVPDLLGKPKKLNQLKTELRRKFSKTYFHFVARSDYSLNTPGPDV